MLRSVFIFLIITCTTNVAFAQESLYKVKGKVVDDLTKLPLANVSIRVQGNLVGTSSDSTGVFQLSTKEKALVLQFSIIGYKTIFVQTSAPGYPDLKVELSQETQLLNEVDISSSPLENVVKSKNSNVLDYSFEGDNIILITYVNNIARSKLILLSSSLDTLSKLNLPEEPLSLFKDCLGYNHVICEKSIYQVYRDSLQVKLMPAGSISDFEKIIYPCAASDSVNLYTCAKSGAEAYTYDNEGNNSGGSASRTANHTVQYTLINKLTKERKKLLTVVDEETIKKRKEELQNEKIKSDAGLYYYGNTTIPHGSTELDRVFSETIEFKDIYIPLVKIKNTTYVFDHVNSLLYSFSSSGSELNKIAINYHKEKNWKREICVDPISGRSFALFQSKGISELREIDLNTGKIIKTYKIPFVFAGNIKVYKNRAYFIHKSNDYYPTKALTRLKLD